jgi:segregation and condensation protein A
VEELELTDIDEEIDAVVQTRLPLHLERHLRRRPAAPPPKRRPVTLQELIDQLQQMAAQLGEPPLRSRSLRPRSVSRTQAAKTIAHLAHDENLTEIATRLEVFLSHHWQELAAGKDWLNLDQLLEWWTASPTASAQADSQRDSLAAREAAVDVTELPANDRVGVFWALLLLSAQSKVELIQEEFYQDLKIRTLG